MSLVRCGCLSVRFLFPRTQGYVFLFQNRDRSETIALPGLTIPYLKLLGQDIRRVNRSEMSRANGAERSKKVD